MQGYGACEVNNIGYPDLQCDITGRQDGWCVIGTRIWWGVSFVP
jgi:hypothetical protein